MVGPSSDMMVPRSLTSCGELAVQVKGNGLFWCDLEQARFKRLDPAFPRAWGGDHSVPVRGCEAF